MSSSGCVSASPLSIYLTRLNGKSVSAQNIQNYLFFSLSKWDYLKKLPRLILPSSEKEGKKAISQTFFYLSTDHFCLISFKLIHQSRGRKWQEKLMVEKKSLSYHHHHDGDECYYIELNPIPSNSLILSPILFPPPFCIPYPFIF